jgi:CheY-like chemotaxis protein
MTRILVADDKRNFRKDAKQILERDNEFDVVDVDNPEAALQKLKTEDFDAAIIDLRLRGGDQYDRSGLDVARGSEKAIPIILVSEFGDDQETIAEAVGTRRDGYPLLVKFLRKQAISDRPEVLLATVRDALNWREQRTKSEREKINPQLLKHYQSDATWLHVYQVAHYLTTLIFVFLVFLASYREHSLANLGFTLFAVIAGEFTNIWISHRAGSIAQRADKNHSELLQATRFFQLFDACSAIDNPQAKDRARLDLIKIAAENWLVPETSSKRTLLLTPGSTVKEGPTP